MGRLLYLVKFQIFLVVLYAIIRTASPIQCFKCQSDGILDISCASSYQLEDCGFDSNGRAYNACYSRNQTNNFPAIGIRYTEDKGCAFHGRECDFLRTILCHDIDGFLLNCSLTCCVRDYCNQGRLSFPTKASTTREDSIARTKPALAISSDKASQKFTTTPTPTTVTVSAAFDVKTWKSVVSIATALLINRVLNII